MVSCLWKYKTFKTLKIRYFFKILAIYWSRNFSYHSNIASLNSSHTQFCLQESLFSLYLHLLSPDLNALVQASWHSVHDIHQRLDSDGSKLIADELFELVKFPGLPCIDVVLYQSPEPWLKQANSRDEGLGRSRLEEQGRGPGRTSPDNKKVWFNFAFNIYFLFF